MKTRQMEKSLSDLSAEVGNRLQSKGLMLSVAESCTGGWLAKVVTDIPGSSGWFDRGFVTYTNQAKIDMLGVAAETLAAQGAVSEETVCEMAAGALARSRAQISVAISGVAGPGGGTPDKPVGTVWLAWARGGAVMARKASLRGDREAVRRESVVLALQGLLELLADV